MSEKPEKRGRVYLVGAGPGDEGLITARGLALLREADVVVHDALVLASLLAEARGDGELIDVGKRHDDEQRLEQEQINELLLEHALAGRMVVRLKGGDPFVFGRGAEEAAFLGKRGVAVEVVPGVTAGIAAAAMAGIPVTHREHSSAVAFITGHEADKDSPANDYAALAGLVNAGGTLVIYMGMARLGEIAAELQRCGAAGDMPAAVVQWGATPRQRSLRVTLGKVAEEAKRAGLCAPAIVIVGRVAAIEAAGLDAYASRPLFGQRVVITRTRTQASSQRAKLAALGAAVMEAPTIEITQPNEATWAKIDAAMRDLNRYDWLVLTSANGVGMLAARLDHLGLDSRCLAPVKIAAIGDATGAALREMMRVRADLVPRTYVAESLAAELIEAGATGKRFLMLRADIARKALPKLLAEAGATVEEYPIYQNVMVERLPEDVLAALREGTVNWVTFTSSSTAKNMAALLGGERDLLKRAKLASIGPVTSATLRELGYEPSAEADPCNIDGLIAAMVRHGGANASGD